MPEAQSAAHTTTSPDAPVPVDTTNVEAQGVLPVCITGLMVVAMAPTCTMSVIRDWLSPLAPSQNSPSVWSGDGMPSAHAADHNTTAPIAPDPVETTNVLGVLTGGIMGLMVVAMAPACTVSLMPGCSVGSLPPLAR